MNSGISAVCMSSVSITLLPYQIDPSSRRTCPDDMKSPVAANRYLEASVKLSHHLIHLKLVPSGDDSLCFKSEESDMLSDAPPKPSLQTCKLGEDQRPGPD